jgi:hypothetical protein
MHFIRISMVTSMIPTNHCTEEQAQLLEEFQQKFKAFNWEFFAVVGDPKAGTGASIFGTTSESPVDSAARHARNAHIEWEVQHGIDPLHSRDTRE